jgi:hypothetical protein
VATWNRGGRFARLCTNICTIWPADRSQAPAQEDAFRRDTQMRHNDMLVCVCVCGSAMIDSNEQFEKETTKQVGRVKGFSVY